MNKKVELIFLTNLPSFYKVNLYNEISKRRKVLVIYTCDSSEDRNEDFFYQKSNFESVYLADNKITRLFQLCSLLLRISYLELIIGGWDSLPMWLAAFVSCKRKNAFVIESSYYESITRGIKGVVKRIFLRRVSKVYASGKAQSKVVSFLGFQGDIVITKGVGIFNYIEQPYFKARTEVKNFIYVGRLVDVKNLPFLINAFNKRQDLRLNIIGFGKQEQYLKTISNGNIKFYGAIDNKELNRYYQENDVFILPSKSEPWGLVVEEALNNGLPILVSNRVGCAEELLEEGKNGLSFKYDNEEDLLDKIEQIRNISLYNAMRKNISNMDFKAIEQYQVNCYL